MQTWESKQISRKQVDYVIGMNNLYELIKDVPGHIIELGTGKGRNAVIFGSLIKYHRHQAFRDYYGFDTFAGYPEHVLAQNDDFKASSHSDFSVETIRDYLKENEMSDLAYLFQGDICEELPKFLERGNFKFRSKMFLAALVYVDCNDYSTALQSLRALKPHLSPGAVIAVDECKMGGETRALLQFAKENMLKPRCGDLGGVISSYLVWEAGVGPAKPQAVTEKAEKQKA